jgi:hypothetical protein
MKKTAFLMLFISIFGQNIFGQNEISKKNEAAFRNYKALSDIGPSSSLNHPNANPRVCFTENKGQVCDQNFKPRRDVLFSGTDGQFVFHLKHTGVSYQLSRVDSWKQIAEFPEEKGKKARQIPDSSTIYRLDFDWVGANPLATITKKGMLDDYNNFYLAHCPQGITNVKSYNQISYKNIYDGIDMVWYEKNGKLEYDYQVSAGADYHQIKMAIQGADSMYLSEKGDLLLATPLGILTKQSPVVIQNGKVLPVRWIIENNTIQFEIDNLDSNQPFVIDPIVRLWGTYYGGGNNFCIVRMTIDKSGDVYMSGGTTSHTGTQIATVGSHQSIFGGGATDAFLVKFNASGLRQWGTYYGGSDQEYGMSCVTDTSGFVYLSGQTKSTTAIATPGSHQTVYRGGYYFGDAFLVKFNSAGVRQWGTYYGGSEEDRGWSCATDSLNNVYLTGVTNSSQGISTTGSHQVFLQGSGYGDGFLVKFNSAGVRQWGTYYGGFGNDQVFACIADPSGNIYITGETFSFGNGIATPGSHQPDCNGGVYHGDAFLAKFNTNGVREWGTYYGGPDDEMFSWWSSALAIDDSSNIYLAASTYSISEIASSGSHQEALSIGIIGSQDAFLVKFNSAGVRQWGTYYGDIGEDYGLSCATDHKGNVFLFGTADLEPLDSTSIVFTTTGCYQPQSGGGRKDAFLVKFNHDGVREWGTYFGGPSDEEAGVCFTDKNGVIYLSGLTYSPSGISTSNGHQPVFQGGISDFNTYLVKLTENVFNTSLSICTNDFPYLWYGQSLTTPGNYTTIVTTSTGFDSVINLTLIANTPSQSTTYVDVCSNQLPYAWNGISYDKAGSYTVALMNAAGCDSMATLMLSLSNPDYEAIRIFPNPAADYLDIFFQTNNSCAVPISGEIKIYNALGQFVHHEKQTLASPPYTIRINIRHFASGVYLIKIGNITKKIIVAR